MLNGFATAPDDELSAFLKPEVLPDHGESLCSANSQTTRQSGDPDIDSA